jgi:hypothetical protein
MLWSLSTYPLRNLDEIYGVPSPFRLILIQGVAEKVVDTSTAHGYAPVVLGILNGGSLRAV